MDTIKFRNGIMTIIDQTKLPTEEVILNIDNVEDCWQSIRVLAVRGAPAIGDAGACGVAIGALKIKEDNFENFYKEFKENCDYLGTSRPTAVNLFWAIERMDRVCVANKDKSIDELKLILEKEAQDIIQEDADTCKAIGVHGEKLLKDGMTVLTHCNAGRLATANYGTALAPIYMAKECGKDVKVFADETRPLLQGARLTTYELMDAGVDVTLITDSMAAYVMKLGKIDMVIVGCDRVSSNGDVANKIGTYGVAQLAKIHNIPFYVAGPKSTIDMKMKSGDQIVIEERAAEEITNGFGKQTATDNVTVFNPAFDVTDHELITAFITEKGVIYPPFEDNFKKLFED